MIEPYDGTKVQVGYRVRSLLHGWGVVILVTNNSVRPINVRFDSEADNTICFFKSGKWYEENAYPCLVEMEAPKRKVKGWVNVISDGAGLEVVPDIYPLEADAKKYGPPDKIATVPIEFEV